MNQPVKIAYIAPEIPALSATFVYNEILGLEERGFEILPISVHVPGTVAEGDRLKALSNNTVYLYRESFWTALKAVIRMFCKRPLKFLMAGQVAVSDCLKTGLFSHTGLGLLYRFFKSSLVANMLIENNCRHLHANFAHVPTDIGMYAAMISGISFSFTSHANDLYERGWLLREKVDRSLFAVTISEHNRQFLIEQGALAEKIHIIRCGVDSRSFPAICRTRMSTVLRIGSLGRMVEKKGFKTLVSACDVLKRKGIPFHLDIAGDGPLKEELWEMVLSQGLSSEVTFKGSLPHDQVPGWLMHQDLFILPCQKDGNGDMDGIPVVLMEAMLSGVPVISSKISGIPELVEDGENGLLMEPEDTEELAKLIQRIISDRNLRKHLHYNGIRKVRTEFDLFNNIDMFSNILKEVLA